MKYIILLSSLFVVIMCNAIDLNTVIYNINNGQVKEGIEQLELLANDNDSIAQYQLGKFYYDGVKIKRSYQTAIKWFIKSGDNNNIEAQLIVAEMYENGKGTFGDTIESMKWYEKASIKSNYAKYKLGCYKFNLNIDDVNANELLVQAGENGIADSYCVMGREYYNRFFSGGREEGDDKKCIKYFSKAAKMNDIEAIYMKNMLSLDKKELIDGIRMSADYGLGNAFYMIYFMYCFQDKRYTKEISRVEAYKSMLIAEKLLGHNIQVEQKVTIDKLNFTKEEIEEATKQANEWKPKPLPPQPVVK